MRSSTAWHRAFSLIFSVLFFASTHAAAQAGQLDPSFGQGGIVTTDFGNQINSNIATATAVTIQPDGKILVCGGIPSSTGFPVAAIARYHSDGSLDSGFGTGGITVTKTLGTPTAIALQTDGKILVSGPTGGLKIAVARYSSNGSLDPTFGTGGIFTSRFNLGISGQSLMVVQPDGKILVADGILLRLLPDGQVDSSFGNAGEAVVVGSSTTSLALLPNGKILVGAGNDFVTRYQSTGRLDKSFAINGQLPTAGAANALVLLSSGEFLVGGSLVSSLTKPATTGFAVSGYQAIGAVDTRFATNGGVVTPVPNFTTVATSGLALELNGFIVTFGTASAKSGSLAFALARYTGTGQLDTTFGLNGTVTTSFGTTSLAGNGLAIQADGKIVAVGGFTTTVPHGEFDTGFKLARYLGQ